MSRIDRLKQIARAISPQKVDFSAFDAELEKIKKSLEETVNIQTVDDVSRKLKQFQSKIDFTPLLNEIETIRNLFGQNTKDLENRIAEKNKELITAGDTRNLTQLNLLREEISNLKGDLSALPKVDLEPLNKIVRDVRSTQLAFNERLSNINLKDYSTTEEATKVLDEAVRTLRVDLLNRLSKYGGGSINRQIYVGNTDALSRYSDVTLKAGSNVTLTVANNNTTKRAEITIAASGSGGGTVRSINSISGNTTAGSTSGTDYVYLVTGTVTLTLPDAAANTNLYTIKNVGSGTVTIATTSSQTIDGASTIVMPLQYTAVDLISDTAGWNVT